jgi:hypothetical protein
MISSQTTNTDGVVIESQDYSGQISLDTFLKIIKGLSSRNWVKVEELTTNLPIQSYTQNSVPAHL